MRRLRDAPRSKRTEREEPMDENQERRVKGGKGAISLPVFQNEFGFSVDVTGASGRAWRKAKDRKIRHKATLSFASEKRQDLQRVQQHRQQSRSSPYPCWCGQRRSSQTALSCLWEEEFLFVSIPGFKGRK
jgi:hypothetical protein